MPKKLAAAQILLIRRVRVWDWICSRVEVIRSIRGILDIWGFWEMSMGMGLGIRRRVSRI